MPCVGTNISRLLWNEHVSGSHCTHIVTCHASDEIERRFTPAERFAGGSCTVLVQTLICHTRTVFDIL